MNRFGKLCVTLAAVSVSANAYAHEDVRPLTQPTPSYPADAILQKLSGRCEVRFDVDLRGQVVDPVALCTHPFFCEEVIRTISAVTFAPNDEEEHSLPYYGAVYPFEFSISGDRVTSKNAPFRECKGKAQAVS